jgi:cell division protein FtsB
MNRPSHDEYEEVESPYATKSADKSKLRTKKNVFNRPFAADPVIAPTVFETISTSNRRSIGHQGEMDLNHHRASELSETQIEYLEEEDEEEEAPKKRPPRSSATKKSTKTKTDLLSKFAWSVVGLLVLRLIFMDRGVWDYFATKGRIQEMNDDLTSVRKENKDIKAEIGSIQMDRNYQRQLAKEHLGVIAADEFMILFAGESVDNNTTTTNPNTQL